MIISGGQIISKYSFVLLITISVLSNVWLFVIEIIIVV